MEGDIAINTDNNLNMNSSKQKHKAWKFAILIASMTATIFFGIASSLFSLIYEDLIITYDSTTTMAGWIGSLQLGIGNVLLIFSGVLFEKFGMQKVGIGSSIICSVCYIISYLTTSLLVTAISMGFVAGICLGLMDIIGFIMGYSYASEKERAFNGNIISFGYYIGFFLGGFILRFYPSHWPWKYILILYACINLQFVPLCVLFFKDSYFNSSNDESEENSSSMKKENILSVEAGDVGNKNSCANTKIQKEKDIEVDVEETEEKLLLKNQQKELELNVTPKKGGSKKQDTLSNSSQRSLQNQHDKTLNSVQIYIQKLSIILKDLKCVCYFISSFIIHFSFLTFFQHGPRWMLTLGLSKEDSSYFPMVVAIISVIAKCINILLSLTLFNRVDKVQPVILHVGVFMLGTMASAFIQIASPLCYSLLSVASLVAVYSIFVGIFTSYHSVITLGLVGHERLPQGNILFTVFAGIGCLISTPFGGFLYDNYDYTVTFVVTGILFVVGSLFSLLIILLFVFRKQKS